MRLVHLLFILYCSAFLFASKVDAHTLHKLTLKPKDTLRLERNYGRTWYELHILKGQKYEIIDVVNADQVQLYASLELRKADILKPTIFEFRLNRVGHEKHFAFELDERMPRKLYLCITHHKKNKHPYSSVFLTTKNKLQGYVEKQYYQDRYNNAFIILMLGAFFLQIVYNTILAFSRRRAEYFFLLLFCLEYSRLHFVFFQYQLGWDMHVLAFPNDIYISTCLLLIYYQLFFRFFYPKIKKIADIGISYISLNLLIYLGLKAMDQIPVLVEFEGISLLSTYLVCFGLLYFIYRLDDPTKYFFLVGTISLLVGAISSRLIFAFNIAGEYDHYTLRMASYLFDFIMLNAALNYRYNQEKREQQQKLENERNRIASELHDDLGAGLSSIRLMSEVAKSDVESVLKYANIERIAQVANDLIEGMATIIWAMNAKNDTLLNLITHLRRYSKEYLDDYNIVCHFPRLNQLQYNQLAQVAMTGEKRRHVFLTFKESLHNISKHAQATEVNIQCAFTSQNITITVQDNGCGFVPDQYEGNGLKNMRRRIEEIGGKFTLFSEKGRGTTLTFLIPY